MKVLSFRDLKLCSRFAGMNEIEMLSIENDENMAWALEQVGFDIDYAVSYVPANHRDMANKTGIGFMAVGEININRSYINSSMSTLMERMIAAAYTDPSLVKELSSLVGMRNNIRSLMENGNDSSTEDLPEDMLEPDREFVGQQINDLKDLRDRIRGDLYNNRGEPKCYWEYKV